jgi:DNA-binding MurR/RpiR family transcriptional regulator
LDGVVTDRYGLSLRGLLVTVSEPAKEPMAYERCLMTATLLVVPALDGAEQFAGRHEHPTDMALGTVAEVAERSKVQPSAIVRFVNAIGYSGFTEMQQVFRTRLVDSAVPSYKERITRMRRDGRFSGANNPRSVLERFASEGIVSLESLQDRVREGDLAHAIQILNAPKNIYVLGLGGSFPVAAHLTYVLHKLGRHVTMLDGLGSAILDQASQATPRMR